MPALWVGTSGYVYRHWRDGVFYPPGLRASDELAWYATRFRTVELNNPFYRVPTVETVARWRDTVPDDFRFAVKVSRVISHHLRLRNSAESLREFLARATVPRAPARPAAGATAAPVSARPRAVGDVSRIAAGGVSLGDRVS